MPIPIEVIANNDGNDQHVRYSIIGRKSDGKAIRILPIITVTASDLASFKWIDKWGFAANIYPPYGRNKDILRCVTAAIGAQTATTKTIYTHTGWQQIDGRWCYLHGNGAIGADNIDVQLDNDLALYGMPNNTGDKDTRDNALRTVFSVADVHILLPIIALVFLCPLNEFLRQSKIEPSFVMYLVGHTGSRKSTLAAIMLSFFGRFGIDDLPANYRDTIGSIELKGSVLKDTLLVVDDYHPATTSERHNMDRTMQALSRMYGNRSARGRLKSNNRLCTSNIPHGNVIVTGEDIADIGQSGLARNLTIEVPPNAIPIGDTLDNAQAYAEDGTLSSIMRDYIEWLMPKASDLPDNLNIIFRLYRKRASDYIKCGLRRTNDIIAWLMTSLYMLLLYINDRHIDGIDISDWWAILTQIASNQIEQSQTVTPTQMFLTAVGQLMATAMIYVDDINSPPIINHKIGKKVGYADTDNYYFYHNIIYEAVINYYSRLRQTYPISCQRLLKQLADEGISITSRGRYVYQKRIGNANDRYLCIPKSYIDYQSGGQDDGNTD